MRRNGDQATHRTRARQRGLTLIELMIAMLISSILVGFMFGTYTRMSTAYRSQTSISEVQQRLRLAKEMIVRDMRPAGNLLAQGFAVNPAVDTAAPTMDLRNPVPPVFTQTGGGSTPDMISVFYADTTIGTVITNRISDTLVDVRNAALFDGNPTFQGGNWLAVIIRPYDITTPPYGTGYRACVVEITNVGFNQLFFDTSTGTEYNSATNGHCDFPDPPPSGPVTSIIEAGSLIYAFGARGYRIDPNPANLTAGVLQRSLTGGMPATGQMILRLRPDIWTDIGLGFTDLQVARRYIEEGDITDSDLEPDENGNFNPALDWFSGPDADPPPAGVTLPIDTALLTEIGISLTARTIRETAGAGSQTTPALTEGVLNHNAIGDSLAIPLASVPVFLRPLGHQGNYIYRSTSVRIDIRNQMATRGEFLKRL